MQHNYVGDVLHLRPNHLGGWGLGPVIEDFDIHSSTQLGLNDWITNLTYVLD